ncbi:MAG: PAS domain S-box protein [Byssovorax sp.]
MTARFSAPASTLEQSQDQLHLLVEQVREYAIFLLDTSGQVHTWNTGAERIKGYEAAEIVGQHFSVFYTPEDLALGKPARQLARAEAEGHCEDEGWRVRKDGSLFWASVVITALRGPDGELRGFGKVTRDMTQRRRDEERRDPVRRRKDGSLIEVSLSVSAVRDGEGALVGVATIGHDITDRKRIERALARARRPIGSPSTPLASGCGRGS